MEIDRERKVERIKQEERKDEDVKGKIRNRKKGEKERKGKP